MPRIVAALVGLVLAGGAAVADPLVLSIVEAKAGHDEATNAPIVSLRMTDESGKAFADFTARNVGRTVIISVDGKIVSSPVVRDPILGGSVIISGELDDAEAKALAEQIAKGRVSVDTEAGE